MCTRYARETWRQDKRPGRQAWPPLRARTVGRWSPRTRGVAVLRSAFAPRACDASRAYQTVEVTKRTLDSLAECAWDGWLISLILAIPVR
jgi:hypothetical protein